jgi:hypothetical protein
MRADMKNMPRNLHHMEFCSAKTIWSDTKGTYPCLFRSMSRGATERTYVQVQMVRRMTRRRDWKLKSADWDCQMVMLLGCERIEDGELP